MRASSAVTIALALGLLGCWPADLVPDAGSGDASGPDADVDADADGDASDAEPDDDADAEPDGDPDADPEPCSAAPPSVGLMHTAEQLGFVRDHRHEPPRRAAFDQLMAEADAALGRTPQPIEDFDVPAYYSDSEGHEEAKRRLSDDAFAAYALALAYQLAVSNDTRDRYAETAIDILHAWALVNREVSGADGDLVMVYRGVVLLFAADLVMGYEGRGTEWQGAFQLWAVNVFGQSAWAIEEEGNNRGDWGTLGAVAVDALLGNREAVAAEAGRIRERVEDNIAENGELPEENKRTNSGMWYTYFALTSMTAAVQIVRNTTGEDLYTYVAPNGRSIRLALGALFYYCLYPDRWPYELPDGIAGELYRLLYPCADEVEIPTPASWPGNLLEAMAPVYGETSWSDWVAASRPIRGWQAWLYPTLFAGAP